MAEVRSLHVNRESHQALSVLLCERRLGIYIGEINDGELKLRPLPSLPARPVPTLLYQVSSPS